MLWCCHRLCQHHQGRFWLFAWNIHASREHTYNQDSHESFYSLVYLLILWRESFPAKINCSIYLFFLLIHCREWARDLKEHETWSHQYPHLVPDLPESFPCGSVGKESTLNVGDLGWIPGLGRSPGEGKGSLLQYSGLENSMDCIGVAKSWIWLRDFHFTSLLPEETMWPWVSVLTSLSLFSLIEKYYLSLKFYKNSW